ncbi:hypothetical protein D3C81_774560 [compost metagenome]
MEQHFRFPVQPIRRPVGSDIGPVPPNASDFLAAHRLPDILTVQNILFGHQHRSVSRYHLLRNRRHGMVDLPAVITQDRKGNRNHEPQADP